MSTLVLRSGRVFMQWFGAGVVGLSLFYYLLLFLITQDPSHPFSQFMLFQPWMSLLILGFGIQIGLYNLMRKGMYFSLQTASDARMAAGTSSTVSGMAMVACCAHHAVDLLPILGLSAATVFLSQYQQQFLIFGVVTNLLGILLMLWLLTGRIKLAKICTNIFYQIRGNYEY